MGLEVLTEISGRPSVVIVGSPNVGKHSLLKRMSNLPEHCIDFREDGLTLKH